ncbi:DoxX family protein [Nocardia donostiensis]|uniref:DoxX family protein n=1 Tax=Nocardia donostiensis TaxID=1538463 RepID=A0A1W0BKF8_9NOCA|nr:DoxX family protein [Nocardia donostiensis]ONM48824.1 hypothetical protein B0T46_10070 [Nocardia donostiensis]OQS22921.1 hypothetical protein B0T44_04395 [Nocardia donostiensis]
MFTTVAMLLVPTLIFRALGAFGVSRFAGWRLSFTHGLAVMLLMTGLAHFMPDSVEVMPGHDDLTAMVPSFVPFPDFMVYLTGVLEIACAVGLFFASTRTLSAATLIVLFIVMLPANINAAVNDIPFDGDPATPLWFRIPEQLVYIAVAFGAITIAGNGWARRLPNPGRLAVSPTQN